MMSVMNTRSLLLLGSTGSVGTQALALVAQHRDRFGVPRAAGADVVVVGVDGVPARVAGHHLEHAVERAVDRVETPEAATGQNERRHAREPTPAAEGQP